MCFTNQYRRNISVQQNRSNEKNEKIMSLKMTRNSWMNRPQKAFNVKQKLCVHSKSHWCTFCTFNELH